MTRGILTVLTTLVCLFLAFITFVTPFAVYFGNSQPDKFDPTFRNMMIATAVSAFLLELLLFALRRWLFWIRRKMDIASAGGAVAFMVLYGLQAVFAYLSIVAFLAQYFLWGDKSVVVPATLLGFAAVGLGLPLLPPRQKMPFIE